MWAIEEFVKYALSKADVRVVPFINIIRWLRDPVPLDGVTISFKQGTPAVKEVPIRINAQGVVYVPGIGQGNLSIYNSAGQLVDAGTVKKGSSTRAFSLSRGLYILKVSGCSCTKIQSVMVYQQFHLPY